MFVFLLLSDFFSFFNLYLFCLNESLVPGLGQTTEASHQSWRRPCRVCDGNKFSRMKVCEINKLTFTS